LPTFPTGVFLASFPTPLCFFSPSFGRIPDRRYPRYSVVVSVKAFFASLQKPPFPTFERNRPSGFACRVVPLFSYSVGTSAFRALRVRSLTSCLFFFFFANDCRLGCFVSRSREGSLLISPTLPEYRGQAPFRPSHASLYSPLDVSLFPLTPCWVLFFIHEPPPRTNPPPTGRPLSGTVDTLLPSTPFTPLAPFPSPHPWNPFSP